jgi:hypothetical protein
MNLLCDISTFQKNNVFFLEMKKNMVIDGFFTKIIYTDSMISLNGLYLHCPIEDRTVDDHGVEPDDATSATESYEVLLPDTKRTTIYFSNTNHNNANILKELYRIEHEIIEQYKEYFKIQKINIYSLRNQLKTNSIKMVIPSDDGRCVNRKQASMNDPFILKISGIWETEMNIGITYKFHI